jgi:hypothetical protein
MCSVYEGTELYDWLRSVEANGPSFLQAMAGVAFMADLKQYSLLRPVLLKMKEGCPKLAVEFSVPIQ